MTRERLVVVGGGMAAVRLVEELRARSWEGSVTVLADEDVAPYNRILLSAVLEGTHSPDALQLRPAAWWEGVDLRLGTRVVEIDRGERAVVLASGEAVPYDRLVLATGSIPTLPPIRGLVRPDGRLHPRVHAFRSLADCRGLDAAIRSLVEVRAQRASSPRAVVVGGGLLGLQVARALSLRGVATEVVEGADHLLAGQVGEPAGQVLARDLRRLGTDVYTGARAVRLTGAGLRLDNGYVLETDLVVLTAGGRPSTALARRAGLDVRRGVVVDQGLTSVTDPRIHAIGDCAQLDGHRAAGFVPPAWEQAGVLAARLCDEGAVEGAADGADGGRASYDGTRSVVRLRATGLDVAVLGEPEREPGEVVEVTNPVTGSHRKLVVRDGVVVGATLVGDLSRVGLLTQLYDRGTVIGPGEAGELLLPERASEPVALLDDAEVCACSGATAGAVRGCGSLEAARATTRATTGCGGCLPVVERLLADHADRALSEPSGAVTGHFGNRPVR
jgi:NAD(P)H-nitrite reductase large subunit